MVASDILAQNLLLADYVENIVGDLESQTGSLSITGQGSCFAGADESSFDALTRYGEASGLAFQIADDILDIVGEQEVLGKDVGSDQSRG
ncbi:MAG: polyprenyl synthetase family protein, partial [Desulfuromonadales bacterium]